MRTLADRHGAAQALIVFLPPALASLDDLVAQGVIAAVREHDIAADIVLAEITHEHVMQRRATEALREAVIAPALARGYRRIWLAGISLGAFNALHYAARFPADVTGLCLLAPYPGTGDILREITAAGGVAAWAESPGRPLDDERAWWHWLWRQSRAGRAAKPVYVGLSEDDRFLQGQRMLMELIPRECVDLVPGAHDWPAWLALWRRWLDRDWSGHDWPGRNGWHGDRSTP